MVVKHVCKLVLLSYPTRTETRPGMQSENQWDAHGCTSVVWGLLKVITTYLDFYLHFIKGSFVTYLKQIVYDIRGDHLHKQIKNHIISHSL